MFHPASPISVLGFLLVCLLVLVIFVLGVWASARRDSVNAWHRTVPVTLGVVIWLSTLSAVVSSGWAEGNPARTVILAASVALVSLAIGLSPVGGWLTGSPLTWLVTFQAFRLPLEVVLHSWAVQGVIPESMTWSGSNWDAVSGIVALLCAPLARRFIGLAWIANGVGLLLLGNVVRVAAMSSPVPFGWPVTPKLLLIYHTPYALIAPVCVGGALVGHIVLTRALLARQSRGSDRP
jgi:hypothetical protein